MFSQSHAKVSASFTNVRSLAVAAFDLVYTAPCLSSSLSLSLTLVRSPRKVGIGLCATPVLKGCSIRAIVSGVPLYVVQYSCCRKQSQS